ncbi:unnamed protein product [Debaryomyces tyrocola]|nr:unnamed protein product [Debaryomyces tyrocola]
MLDMKKDLSREEKEVEKEVEKDVDHVGLEVKEESQIYQQDSTTSEKNISNTNDEFIKRSRGVILMDSIKEMIAMEGKRGKTVWVIGVAVWILMWALGLEKTSTSNYEVFATSSYGNHTLIATSGIASSIISSIGQMFFAKFSDTTSRPLTYVVSVGFFLIGYVIIPTSSTISAYIIGIVFGDLGKSILDLTTTFVIADLTPLKWRGIGIAFVETPLIIIPWFSGLIVDEIVDDNWKWGYGMFTIIIPVILIPIVCFLFYYQRKASELGIVKEKTEKYGIQMESMNKNNWWMKIYNALNEFDLFGLLLLGTSITLILLPLSLYKSADKGWRNPSIIAMFVVGGVILALFVLYELYVASFPCLHRSNFNRTVITEILFNMFYFIASKIGSTYLSSFVLVYKDWSTRDWTYFNNTNTICKSFFGLLAGILHRYTHRYKYLQIFGVCIEIISCGLLVSIRDANTNTATLVMSQILSGMGGGFAVFSSRLAIQAAVSHQNMSMGITTVYLFTSIGKSVGGAIAAAIWNSKTPQNLRKYMPDSVSDEQVDDYFGNLAQLADYPMGSPIRSAAIDAYVDTLYYIFVPALGITFAALIVCFFQKNFYLGNGQNAVEPGENKDHQEESMDFVEKLQAKLANRKKDKYANV